jgi:hypothetical protein
MLLIRDSSIFVLKAMLSLCVTRFVVIVLLLCTLQPSYFHGTVTRGLLVG